MIPTLQQSPVNFDRESHTYWLGEKQLSGVTSTLLHRMNPNKYTGVPQEKLNERAAVGSTIHGIVELYESIGIESDDINLQNYIRMKEEHHLTHLASEYVVSDLERYASPIDHVFIDESDNIVIVDVKTTYSFDREYVRYQLSIYKRFFELQNPDLKVSKIAGMWLHDREYGYYELDLVSDTLLDYLFECESEDKPFVPAEAFSNLPEVVKNTAPAIIEKMRLMDECKAFIDREKAAIYKIMEENDFKSFIGFDLVMTRILPTVRQSFDSARFKKEHPDMYDEYTKESEVKGSLKITLKKK